MGKLLNLLVDILLDAELVSKAGYLLLHLVGHADRDEVALVFFGIVYTNVVVAALLLGPAV